MGGQCKIKTHFADWVLNTVFNVWEFRTGKGKYSTDLTVSEAIPALLPVAPQQTDPRSLCLCAATETLLLPMLLKSNTSGLQDLTILKVLHIAKYCSLHSFRVLCWKTLKIFDLLKPLDFKLLKFTSNLNLVMQLNFYSLYVLCRCFIIISYAHTLL